MLQYGCFKYVLKYLGRTKNIQIRIKSDLLHMQFTLILHLVIRPYQILI